MNRDTLIRIIMNKRPDLSPGFITNMVKSYIEVQNILKDQDKENEKLLKANNILNNLIENYIEANNQVPDTDVRNNLWKTAQQRAGIIPKE